MASPGVPVGSRERHGEGAPTSSSSTLQVSRRAYGDRARPDRRSPLPSARPDDARGSQSDSLAAFAANAPTHRPHGSCTRRSLAYADRAFLVRAAATSDLYQ